MAGASGAYAEYKVKFHEMTEPCWETCWIHPAQPAACLPNSLTNSSMAQPNPTKLLGGKCLSGLWHNWTVLAVGEQLKEAGKALGHLVPWLAAHPALEPSCPHLSLVQSQHCPPLTANPGHCFPCPAHSDPHPGGPLQRLAGRGQAWGRPGSEQGPCSHH